MSASPAVSSRAPSADSEPLLHDPSTPRLPLLDATRAAAALLVLTTHIAFQSGRTEPDGLGLLLARFDVGVAIFFVLSGFLLTEPFLRASSLRTPLWPYYRRRAIRILPAYWLALLVACLTTARDVVDGTSVASNAVLAQIYSADLLPGFTQTWSLCTEWSFYAVLPGLALLVFGAAGRRRSASTVVLALAAGAVACWAWVVVVAGPGVDDRLGLWLPGHLDWFLAGMAMAWLAKQPTGSRGRDALSAAASAPGSCWLLALAVFCLVAPLAGPITLSPIPGTQALVKEIGYGVVAALVVLPGVVAPDRPTAWHRCASARPVRFLGDISYGLFLWHLLVLAGVFALLSWDPFEGRTFAAWILTVVGTLVVAAASWCLLERPLLRRDQRRARR